MEVPKVSVIIPVYNAASFLAETIESVLNQSYENIEIILVDDGSKDSSVEIAKRYLNTQVRLFVQQNAGASAARNRGLREASGHYIQFLDADDILDPDKIRLQVSYLKEAEEGTITSCAWGKFSESIHQAVFKKQRVWNNYKPIDWLVDSWEGGGMMQTACWLVPVTIIKRAGWWNEQLVSNPNDDGEFFCRVLLNAKKIAFIEKARVFYRAGLNESLSRQRNPCAIESLYRTCELYQQYVLPVEDSPRVRHALMRNYLHYIYEFYSCAPVQIRKAKNQILNMGFKKLEITGGNRFKMIAACIGFENALKIRKIFSN